MNVKLKTDALRNIVAFERITRVSPKDCVEEEECVYFLVDSGKVGKAIGKNADNIKELRRVLGKSVKLFSYIDNAEDMIKINIPTVKNIDINNDTIIITVPPQDKINVIGRNGRNIKALRSILKRHFKIEEFKLR